MSINTAFTALADAIRDKSGVSGVLTVAGMTDAVNGIVINPGGGGSDIDFTGVTVTADKLLNGVVAINKNCQKITGTIQDGSVRQDGAEITVSAGYYATDQLIELPTSDVYRDGGTFFAGQGYVPENVELTVPNATVTETETSVTVSPGYVGEELNFELGTPGSNVEYGYIDSDGKIQKLDLSGDAPVDSGTPVEMPIFAFATGQNEPAYDGGGGGSIDFYECSEVGTDSWSGYLMEQDDKGNWSATDQIRTDMPIQGFIPAVNYCYNENTTVIADLYSSDIDVFA